MVNKLMGLSIEEIRLVHGGVNKKQITWRIFQVMLVGGYICYKTYLAVSKVKEIPNNLDRHE